MITAQEYNDLPVGEKNNCLYKDGTYLIHRVGSRHICCLFSLWDFYVEALYEKEAHQIIDAWPVVNTTQLESYLEAFSLEELL